MSAHTPGPWHRYGTNVHKDRAGDVCRPIKRIIAQAEAIDVGEEEAEANAQLIASAPELLRAAKRFMALRGDIFPEVRGAHCCKALEDLVAAIAAAERKAHRKAVRA